MSCVSPGKACHTSAQRLSTYVHGAGAEHQGSCSALPHMGVGWQLAHSSNPPVCDPKVLVLQCASHAQPFMWLLWSVLLVQHVSYRLSRSSVSRPYPGATLPNGSCRVAVYSVYGIIFFYRQDLKKDGLNYVAILLPQTPECWDYRHEPLQPNSLESFFLGDIILVLMK